MSAGVGGGESSSVGVAASVHGRNLDTFLIIFITSLEVETVGIEAAIVIRGETVGSIKLISMISRDDSMPLLDVEY